MAPSHSDKQTELFDTLDGNFPVGVFYCPNLLLSQEAKLSVLEQSILNLQTLSVVLEKHKISAVAAPRYSPLIRWIAGFETFLRAEKEKLLNPKLTPSKSTPESTMAAVDSNVR